MQDRF